MDSKIYDVIIVGGGAAGYGCALTLVSNENKQQWAQNRSYLLIDNGDSDMLKATFYNICGVEFGIKGIELLNKIKDQLNNFKSCKVKNDTVVAIEKVNEKYFTISTVNDTFKATNVVLSTGMHKFDIKCDDVKVVPHNDVMKPNKICLENNDNKIIDGLYVAGLASGVKTMFAIANGDGVKVACDIFKKWTNKSAVAHD